MSDGTVPDTRVPAAADVAAHCPYCERPFGQERLRDLHVGERHRETCTDTERETYERAREAERDDLFTYHIYVVIALGLIYAFMVLGLMVLLSG